jgi:hypothetical protein
LPASPTTGPADESVNVVIMVQPNATATGPAAALAPAPATQPGIESMQSKSRARGPSQDQPALK